MTTDIPGATVVITAGTCQVWLTDLGFYAQCRECPQVSGIIHAKYRARMWAEAHKCETGPDPLRCDSCGEHVADPHAPGCPEDTEPGNPCSVPEADTQA